jgi:hypothetical protein
MSGYMIEDNHWSSYLVDDGDDTYIIDSEGNEKPLEYWSLYSPLQARRNKKVLKQMLDIWWQVESPLRVLRYEGIELNDIMKKVTRLFFGFMRLNKQQENDKKQRAQRLRKITKLKNKVYPI